MSRQGMRNERRAGRVKKKSLRLSQHRREPLLFRNDRSDSKDQFELGGCIQDASFTDQRPFSLPRKLKVRSDSIDEKLLLLVKFRNKLCVTRLASVQNSGLHRLRSLLPGLLNGEARLRLHRFQHSLTTQDWLLRQHGPEADLHFLDTMHMLFYYEASGVELSSSTAGRLSSLAASIDRVWQNG